MDKYGKYGTVRQREEYGGVNIGASFFGWLVAIGIGALLTALLSAAGVALAISELDSGDEAASAADTIGIAGGILILAVALIAYFAGGYVAGRMSRFDGARQGVGVWAWSILVTVVLALIGVIAGSEYNLFAGLDLPRIPIDEGSLTVGGAIVLAIVLIGTLLAAMAGGKAGERYHRKVDELGTDPLGEREHRGRRARVATTHDRDGDGVDDRREVGSGTVRRDRRDTREVQS